MSDAYRNTIFTHTGNSVVLQWLVDIDGDTRVGAVVRAGEADQVRASVGARARDADPSLW